MRKYIFLISVLSGLVAVSCSKLPSETRSFTTLTASVGDIVRTHVAFDGETGIPSSVWDEGDQIALLTKRFPSGLKFTLTDGADSRVGSFSSAVAANDTTVYYAVSPASAARSFTASASGDILKVEYPSTLTPVIGEDFLFCYGADIMVSRSDTRSFSFLNACSYIILSFDGPSNDAISSISVSGKNGETVCGNANIKITDGKPSVAFTDGGKSISVSFGSEGIPFTLSEFICLSVPPVFGDGFIVTVNTVKGVEKSLKSSAVFVDDYGEEVPFGASHMLVMDLIDLN